MLQQIDQASDSNQSDFDGMSTIRIAPGTLKQKTPSSAQSVSTPNSVASLAASRTAVQQQQHARRPTHEEFMAEMVSALPDDDVEFDESHEQLWNMGVSEPVTVRQVSIDAPDLVSTSAQSVFEDATVRVKMHQQLPPPQSSSAPPAIPNKISVETMSQSIKSYTLSHSFVEVLFFIHFTDIFLNLLISFAHEFIRHVLMSLLPLTRFCCPRFSRSTESSRFPISMSPRCSVKFCPNTKILRDE
jgi:hypothetical protein